MKRQKRRPKGSAKEANQPSTSPPSRPPLPVPLPALTRPQTPDEIRAQIDIPLWKRGLISHEAIACHLVQLLLAAYEVTLLELEELRRAHHKRRTATSRHSG